MRLPFTSWRRALAQSLLLLLCAIPPTLLTAWLHPRSPSWPSAALQPGEITLAELRTQRGGYNKVLWVDARRSTVFAGGHIPGAINLNEDDWEGLLPGFIEHWDGRQAVVVYCDSSQCDSSRAVATRLKRELGLSGPDAPPVLTLKGGWDAWQSK